MIKVIQLRNDNKRNKKKEVRVTKNIDFLSLEQELKSKNRKRDLNNANRRKNYKRNRKTH